MTWLGLGDMARPYWLEGRGRIGCGRLVCLLFFQVIKNTILGWLAARHLAGSEKNLLGS